MEIEKKIKEMPRQVKLLLGGSVLLFGYLYATGQWGETTKIMAIGIGFIILMMFFSDTKPRMVSKENAKRIVIEDARKEQIDGNLPQGSLSIGEGRCKRVNGKYVAWALPVSVTGVQKKLWFVDCWTGAVIDFLNIKKDFNLKDIRDVILHKGEKVDWAKLMVGENVAE